MLDTSAADRFRTAAVLVVDDDPGIVRMTGRLLRELGFRHVVHATDGMSALHQLALARFDVVISDWRMAPMSGLELLRRIRQDPRLAAIRFVMVTGKNDPDEAAAAKAAGVDGYLLKPFNLGNLHKQLARALARAG